MRVETKNEARLQKINIVSLVLALTKEMKVQCTFMQIIGNFPAYDEGEHSEEVANSLEKLFTMYLRVRRFSVTRDLVVKLRNKNKDDLKKKILSAKSYSLAAQ